MAGVFISKNSFAQTAGVMSFTVSPVSKSTTYGTSHCVAIWVESASGTFVKTRVRLATSGNASAHLLQWKAKSTSSIVDAQTGATVTSYATPLTYTWQGNDLTGTTPYNLLPDGNYKAWCEYAWGSSTTLGTGRDTCSISFVKGPALYSNGPATATDFTGITVTWTPAAQNTTATSALASNTYCTGASVSVPFTKTGTTTVYANNVWTAQLSNASGSFASPVTIGTLSGATTGTIAATIPGGTTPGTGYRIRVIGSQPATLGTDNNTNITISAPPTAPVVGTITQPSCTVSTGSVDLTGLPASGNWTLNPGNITGSGSSYTVSNLPTGTTTYTVTTGCASPASSSVVITAAPAVPTAPAVGTISQPTCTVATGSVILTGLPSGSWTINPGNIVGNTSTTTIDNLATGTYNYTVTNAATCTSVASANVVVIAQPSIPSAPTVGTITQPTCVVNTGSAVLDGLPSGNWTINPGNITGSSASATIPNLATGTYNFTVTNAASCISVASGDVVVNTAPLPPTTPTVGTITQPTCVVASGEVILTDLPIDSWTINPGNHTGSTSSLNLTGLASGTYNFTVTDVHGCTSNLTADVIINVAPVVPNAPTAGSIIQPTCTVQTGTINVIDLPAGSWTLNPYGISGTGTTFTFSGIGTGTYSCSVTNSDGCHSVMSADFVIDPAPVVPDAPIAGNVTQPTCTLLTGSVDLTGLPSGNWIILPANISGNSTNTTISNLTPGEYYYTVTNTSNCTSDTSFHIIINNPPSIPTTPSIVLNLGTLISDAATGNQWYELSTGIITGATNADFTPTESGNYFVIVTDGSCFSDSSNIVQITMVGVESNKNNNAIMVYPNPVSNELFITANGNDNVGFEILNAMGRIVYKGSLVNKTMVETSAFANGVYVIKLDNGKTFEFKKIIKQ